MAINGRNVARPSPGDPCGAPWSHRVLLGGAGARNASGRCGGSGRSAKSADDGPNAFMEYLHALGCFQRSM